MKGSTVLQVFGQQTVAALLSTMSALASLLACTACDRPLQPSCEVGGQRGYVFLCGCRREPVAADPIERLAQDKVEAPALILDAAPDQLGQVLARLFAQVRVGSPADDLEFVWRL